MGAVLALLASVSWGSGDFLGGTLSRKAHPLAVLQASQGIAIVAILVVAIASGDLGASGYLWWGILGGVVGVLALACFYTALAQGTMGVVAPVAATGAVVPVGISLLQGEAPSVLQLLGIVVAVVGVVLASGPERGTRADTKAGRQAARRPLLLAGIAALGFGGTLSIVAEGSHHSVIMTLLTMRIVNVLISSTLILLVVRRPARPGRSDLGSLAVAGLTDAGANGLYALATREALVSVSSVLASLYPAVTALLAWRFHHERLRPVQVAGVAATLAGVALIAVGSSS